MTWKFRNLVSLQLYLFVYLYIYTHTYKTAIYIPAYYLRENLLTSSASIPISLPRKIYLVLHPVYPSSITTRNTINPSHPPLTYSLNPPTSTPTTTLSKTQKGRLIPARTPQSKGQTRRENANPNSRTPCHQVLRLLLQVRTIRHPRTVWMV